MSRILVVTGIILIVIGLLWGLIGKIGLGHLPGDIVIERDNFRLYIPITSAILVSVVLPVVLTLLNAFLGR